MKSLRILVATVALFLGFSGISALMNPRPLEVGHASVGQIYGGTAYLVERLSTRGTIAYGVMSTALGAALLYGVFMGDLRVARRDRAIAHCIATASPELLRRYGRLEDCSREQIEATADEMKIEGRFLPYLLAAFMGREALRVLEAGEPGIRWPVVEAAVARIFIALPHSELTQSNFHQSWTDSQDL